MHPVEMHAPPHLEWCLIARSSFFALLAIVVFVLMARFILPAPTTSSDEWKEKIVGVPAAEISSPFQYVFSKAGVLHEAGESDESMSPYWWLSSGGMLIIEDGIGKTIQESLASGHTWRTRYLRSNSTDTDNGAHPQNIFRLVTRSSWENVRVEAEFKIVRDQLSISKNRNESNGVLLMTRYINHGETTYYAGIRVDGHAVIKKKYRGTYYTLEEVALYPGSYERTENPTLLPHDVWIPLRVETRSKNAAVTITLFMRDESGVWKTILTAVDDGSDSAGTPPIYGSFPIGIRTDFMDVEFDNVIITRL